jgi:hypothetical protein
MQRVRHADARVAVAPQVRRYLMSVVAREVLQDVAGLLGPQNIPVMPLKGVLLQQLLYSDPAERALTDVDVIVPEHDFERSIQVLLRAGFAPRSAGRSLNECALTAPRGMTVDLHRRLFGRGRYKLSTEALFRRGRQDSDLLGVPIHIAHPHDTAAHLIGKFVSDHEVFDPRARLLELSRWIEHCRIDPLRLVRHLGCCGMSRAARYVFCRGVELLNDSFFAAALAALPSDAVGKASVGLARATLPRLESSPWAALPAHLLNESLLRGGASLTWATVDLMRHAWLVRQKGAQGGVLAVFFSPRSGRQQTIGPREADASTPPSPASLPSQPLLTGFHSERAAPGAKSAHG